MRMLARSPRTSMRKNRSYELTVQSIEAMAPFSKRTQPTSVSSASQGCTNVPMAADTSAGSPQSISNPSSWWIDWLMSTPPPSTPHDPRPGTPA
jgi:hypothetical protein